MKLLVLLAALLPVVLSRAAAPAPGATQFRSGYIIGGKEADVGKWPWQVSLQKYGYHTCGASLISSRWLVTAAHCSSAAASVYRAVLGLHDIDRKMGQPVEHTISRIVKHPYYNNDGYKGYPHDIAVMQLSTSADLSSKYVGVIALPESSDLFEGQQDCFITGWGLMADGTSASRLQEAQVQVYDRNYCVQKWGSKSIGDYHVCVGTSDQGSCNGDSGGPLVCPKNGELVLVGATSWGRSDCSPSYPSIYASVPWVRFWIQYTTGV